MIKNERQYRVALADADRFRSAIKGATPSSKPTMPPRLLEARRAALQSQLDGLCDDLAEYEAIRAGGPVRWPVEISDIPRALIQTRIRRGLSHRQLAKRIGLKEQQIQKYEATDYAQANLSRMAEVGEALGLRLLDPGIRIPRWPHTSLNATDAAGHSLGVTAERQADEVQPLNGVEFLDYARLRLGREPVVSDFEVGSTGGLDRIAEVLREVDEPERVLTIRAIVADGARFWSRAWRGRPLARGQLDGLIEEASQSMLRSLHGYFPESQGERSQIRRQLADALSHFFHLLQRARERDQNRSDLDPLLAWVDEYSDRIDRDVCQGDLRRYMLITRGLTNGRVLRKSRIVELFGHEKSHYKLEDLATYLALDLEDMNALLGNSPTALGLNNLVKFTGYRDFRLAPPPKTPAVQEMAFLGGENVSFSDEALDLDAKWGEFTEEVTAARVRKIVRRLKQKKARQG